MTTKTTHTPDLNIESVTISPREWAEYQTLKAAAPDLLKRCKWALLMLRGGGKPDKCYLDELTDIIAKAEAKP